MKLTLPTILILGMLSGLTPLAIDTYLPSIPTIAKSLDSDINLIQLTLSIYLIIFAAFQIIFGPISDAYGRKKVITFGLILFFLGSILCAVSRDYEWLLAGRALQAFGGAAVAVCVSALVRDAFSAEDFVKAMSYIMLVMAIAPLIAPILGGIILIAFDWHYIFIFLALMACITFILFHKNIPETLSQEKRKPLSFRKALTTYWELLNNPGVFSHIVSGSLHFSGMMCFITASSFVYIELYGVDEANYGFLFALNIIGMMFFTTINSQLVGRIGIRKMASSGMIVLLIASIILAVLAFSATPSLVVIIVACIFYIGTIGVLGSTLVAGALSHAENNNGSVTALAGTTRFAAGALSGTLVSVLHNGTVTPMLVIMATVGILSFISFWFIARNIPMPITSGDG
ncbi:Bcr/CflA family multidrug efflux MFS transporter [Marinomonas sp. 15G1-11]|uniref:Bcr/CflA family efflux transporter n=1 Tax=Marinomonas phaeophyticola TaxID=3004091 RepID=A0ABT4JXQ8_9GAMM|nr:Bcr/CflA family multidrug efflux MFS transporter [Marinomonas sp. 15G1-11]MCZ2722837.1 Bcr/CflA family multidrug efflux MFS transporter [Marinomonas sp. 15G1-11]